MKNTLSEKIQHLLDQAVETENIGRGVVLVRQNGEEIAYAASGINDPRTGTPVQRDSIFRLYSQSKPVTAAAAAILIERGVLDIMSPVSRYLPGFRNPKVLNPTGGADLPADREPIVWDLLAMTAGLSYPGEGDEAGRRAKVLFDENQRLMDEGRGMGTVEFCSRMGELALAFQPGSRFRYSTCADVLGAVIEAASGKRFGEFLQEEIFAPLGMKDTAFHVPPEKLPRLAATHWRKPDGTNDLWVRPHLCCAITTEPPAFESGGAGLYSTVDDYAAFAQMLLNGGELNGVRILQPATVRWLTQPQLSVEEAGLKDGWPYLRGFGYGKLMRVCLQPGAGAGLCSEGEYGWDGWLGTYFSVMPRENAVLLYMTSVLNDRPDDGVIRRLRNVVFAAL